MEICPGAAILGLSGPPKSGRYSKAKTGAQCAAWKTKAGARVIRVERSMVFQKKKKKVGGGGRLFMFWCPMERTQDASLEKTTSFPAALPSWSGSLYRKDTLGRKGPSPGPQF